MEQLYNSFTLEIPPDSFPLSTDSMVLADFVRLSKNANVLDLGSGCGTLGLLLCAADPGCTVTGVEICKSSHRAAEENILQNSLQSRMKSICADLRAIPSLLPAGSFSCCVSNPPYFSGGPASKTNPLARRDDLCTTADLFRSAAWALRYGGDFFLVHKPDRLAQLCSCASQAGLEPKRLRIISHRPESKPAMILLQCRKGAAPGLIWEQISLFHADGSPTPAYKKIYHL